MLAINTYKKFGIMSSVMINTRNVVNVVVGNSKLGDILNPYSLSRIYKRVIRGVDVNDVKPINKIIRPEIFTLPISSVNPIIIKIRVPSYTKLVLSTKYISNKWEFLKTNGKNISPKMTPGKWDRIFMHWRLFPTFMQTITMKSKV